MMQPVGQNTLAMSGRYGLPLMDRKGGGGISLMVMDLGGGVVYLWPMQAVFL